jgi:hypothetical protein
MLILESPALAGAANLQAGRIRIENLDRQDALLS